MVVVQRGMGVQGRLIPRERERDRERERLKVFEMRSLVAEVGEGFVLFRTGVKTKSWPCTHRRKRNPSPERPSAVRVKFRGFYG